MTRQLLRWPALLVAAWVAGCATTPVDGPRPQGFDLLNEGAGDVHDVQVRYGTHVFPPAGATAVVRAPTVTGQGFHQEATVAIPATAQVHWVSVDGRGHDATVPIDTLIADRALFHGVQFVFVDDHLDVVFAYEREAPKPRGLDYLRTWSSAAPRLLSDP
ncbi:MAG TPA: hypothetical protein VIN75_17545 [Burkholderiaceae bacterium]